MFASDVVSLYAERVHLWIYGTAPRLLSIIESPTRRAIVYVLAIHGPLTLKEISEKLKLSPSTVYEHLKKLKDAGIIEEAREYPKRHKMEVYYRLKMPFLLISECSNLEAKAAQYTKALEEQINETFKKIKEIVESSGLRFIELLPERLKEEAVRSLSFSLLATVISNSLWQIARSGLAAYLIIRDVD
ncbi:MAG: ArsR/SmtB family transcription factor [Desulfurococcaceae archaeon]